MKRMSLSIAMLLALVSGVVLATESGGSDAREAFGELSQAFVKYRQEIDGPRPVVAYCSMARKVWLQPEGVLGNPYYGQSMAECGEVVSE